MVAARYSRASIIIVMPVTGIVLALIVLVDVGNDGQSEHTINTHVPFISHVLYYYMNLSVERLLASLVQHITLIGLQTK